MIIYPNRQPSALRHKCAKSFSFAPFIRSSVHTLIIMSSSLRLKQFYIESYGCQMNVNDSEIVAALLSDHGYIMNRDWQHADLILLNTCSIREKAEQTIRRRIQEFRPLKKKKKGLLIGILGCMAERLKEKLLEEEQLVDIVIGPDAYRTLPALIAEAQSGQKAVNVLLSREETYAEINPVRLNSNGVNAFVTIMRGCNNMCSFCVVPFTRGRERSRTPQSILNECHHLYTQGYRDITLLGQNVDSYNYQSDRETTNFARLLAQVAQISPLLRVRFSTSHPKDITDEVLYTMKAYNNICPYIHFPAQSGNSRILSLMRRTYDREWYVHKFNRIKEILPHCAVSTDIIVGFCSETEAEFQDTLSLMDYCRFDLAYMFIYSERPGTPAAKKLPDDVPLADKKRRLNTLIERHRQHACESMQKDIGQIKEVLIEGNSKKDDNFWCGRTPQNKMVIFPKNNHLLQPGDYVQVRINTSTSATLLGSIADTVAPAPLLTY